ncbi:MAG TPA: hypothetical protein VJ723_06525 [Candidatus Angelobacter sp.]|nr:hypothetical protein [Candidatus Angelobacter sp.]
MNCQQFQENLPHTIDSGGSKEEEAHLRSCPECASVVQDLKYIANQARLLLPMHDPSPRVWQNIQSSLRNEGLISEGRTQLIGQKTIGQIPLPSQTKNWTPLGWALGLAAVLLLGIVLVNYRPASDPQQDLVQNTAGPAFKGADQELLGQVSQHQPDMRAAYEDSLKSVNAYIVDAKKTVDDNPEDAAAQQQLMDAYDQKAMLYEMATARALQ